MRISEYIPKNSLPAFLDPVRDALGALLKEHLELEFIDICCEACGEAAGSQKASEDLYDEFAKYPFQNVSVDISDDNETLGVINIIYKKSFLPPAFSYSIEDGIPTIECCLSDKCPKSTYIRLMKHEMLHALQDANMRGKYSLSIREYNGPEYANSVRSFSDKGILGELGRALYLLCDEERNAYMSSLKSDITEIIDRHGWNRFNIDINRLKDELMRTDIWEKYADAGKFINAVKYGKIDEDELLNAYKLLTSSDYADRMKDSDFDMSKLKEDELTDDSITYHKLKRYLWNKWVKFMKKLNTIMSRICREAAESRNGLAPATEGFWIPEANTDDIKISIKKL